MRHVSRTHRVALDWLFDRINLDPKIQIKYIDTKNQPADILTIERGDLFQTLTHQATQNGMLIRLGLLKSGNLMNLWKLEQGDLFYSHSTRTDSLLKTIIWILTPKQNQTCC